MSPFTDSQLAVFLLSKAPLYLWPKPLKNVWFHVSSLSNSAILNFQFVPGYAGIPGINKHADSLPKAGTSLATAIVHCSSLQLLPKFVTYGVTNGDVTFSHFPSHLKCPIPTVSPLELVLTRPICFELSAFACKAKDSYSCCYSVIGKNLPAAPMDTFYSFLIVFFLTVLHLSLYANPSLALKSALWPVAQLLGLRDVPLLLHSSERVG